MAQSCVWCFFYGLPSTGHHSSWIINIINLQTLFPWANHQIDVTMCLCQQCQVFAGTSIDVTALNVQPGARCQQEATENFDWFAVHVIRQSLSVFLRKVSSGFQSQDQHRSTIPICNQFRLPWFSFNLFQRFRAYGSNGRLLLDAQLLGTRCGIEAAGVELSNGSWVVSISGSWSVDSFLSSPKTRTARWNPGTRERNLLLGCKAGLMCPLWSFVCPLVSNPISWVFWFSLK